MEPIPVYLLVFASIFQILGAGAMGIGLHGIWQAVRAQSGDPIAGNLFFAIFGSLFACFPLAVWLNPRTPGWFIWIQLSLLLFSAIIAAFYWRPLLNGLISLFNFNTALVILGLLFIIGGAFGSYVTFTGGESFLTSVTIGGIFIVIGSGIAVLGLINHYRGPSS